ncbi:hypothetical protein Tco_0887064 [Tanacetum coccineum]
MKIPDWMISDEMKHTEHYRMYAEVFGIDVPLTLRSTRLTPPAPMPTVDKADEMILQDTLQEVMVESLPTMVDKHIKDQVEKQVPEHVKVHVPLYVVKGLFLKRQQNKEETD